MKKIILLLFACCLSVFAIAQTKSKGGTATKEKIEKWRLCIAFTSHASGIDGPKYDAIETHVKNHAKKPKYEMIQQGREGEREIRMQLKEFSKKEAVAFVDEIKKLAEGSDRVLVNENCERVKKQ